MKKATRKQHDAVLTEAGYNPVLISLLDDKQIKHEVRCLNRKSNAQISRARRQARKDTLDSQASALGMARTFIGKVKLSASKAWDKAHAEVDAEALKNRVEYLNAQNDID